jgi:hypothetical protein
MQGRTLVAGPDGPKRIDELRAGDRVWSRGNDGQLAEQKIVSAWRSVDQEFYRLRLRGRNVDATANHRFLRVKPVHHKTTGGRAMIRTCGWSSAGEGEGAHLPEEDLVATGI